nr:MAG TPA: hypothetical protein [Bacteriophage sp.]
MFATPCPFPDEALSLIPVPSVAINIFQSFKAIL